MGVGVGDTVFATNEGFNVGVSIGSIVGLDKGVAVWSRRGLNVLGAVGPGVGDVVGESG